MSDVNPQVLVVVRASPIRDRTAALLESIALQKAAGTVRVVVLSQRKVATGPGLPVEDAEHLQAEPDWAEQVLRLAETSGCRWLVLPSSVDRYLPGAFEAVVELGATAGRTIVGACQVIRDGQILRIGPDPFRFDYFALLSGFNYIAPGATFIDIGRCLEAGGFDPRYPSCPTYEYVLRTGAAGGVDCCPVPILETEAEPFPGIPSDWAALHASEALSVTLNYNKFFVTPGAALGLLAALADRLEPYVHMGFHDEQVLNRLAGAAADLKHRYIEQLGVHTAPLVATAPFVADPLAMQSAAEDEAAQSTRFAEPLPRVSLRTRVKSRVKMVTPRPIWDTLRRAKRACKAFRRPLY
jgi:hypothetical protein